jgi:hypothetical protein
MDVIALYRYKENLYGKGSYFIALDALDPTSPDRERLHIEEKDKRHKLLEECMEVYISELNSSKGLKAREYLEARGFNKTLVDMMGIGLASHSGILLEYGLDKNQLEDQRLISYEKEVMDKRIIFPVRDTSNRLVHFTGRYLGDIAKDKEGEPLYPKWKHTLSVDDYPSIGSYLALEELIPSYKGDQLFLTEGYADALCMYSKGIECVGSFGLNGLGKHANKMSKFNELIAIYDIDHFDEDHPTYPLEYKSWRVVLPQLVDMQILNPMLTISLFFIKGEGKNKSGSLYKCKDINDWLLAADPSKEEILAEIDKDKVGLVTYMINKNGSDMQCHEELIRLCVSTGKGANELERYVPPSYSALTYAMRIMSV